MTEGKDLFSASNMEIDHGFSRFVMYYQNYPKCDFKAEKQVKCDLRWVCIEIEGVHKKKIIYILCCSKIS